MIHSENGSIQIGQPVYPQCDDDRTRHKQLGTGEGVFVQGEPLPTPRSLSLFLPLTLTTTLLALVSETWLSSKLYHLPVSLFLAYAVSGEKIGRGGGGLQQRMFKALVSLTVSSTKSTKVVWHGIQVIQRLWVILIYYVFRQVQSTAGEKGLKTLHRKWKK